MWDHLPAAWQDTEEGVHDDNGWDIAHVNSVGEAPDGNIVVSFRNLNQVIKIDRTTGRVLWRLGGKRSSFKIEGDPNGQFAAQHDAREIDDNVITLFDNAYCTGDEHARAMDYELKFDNVTGEPTVAKMTSMWKSGVTALAKGSYRRLKNGNRAVSLGFDLLPHACKGDSKGAPPTNIGNHFYVETDPGGALLISMSWDCECHSYRSIKAPWTGRPTWKPVAVIDSNNSDNVLQLHFSWNGATEVASWRVTQGDGRFIFKPFATVAKTQFEHWVQIEAGRRQCLYYRAEALDESDTVLGYTDVVESPGCMSD